MQKTAYHKPATEVVILQQRGQVLIGSPDGQAGVENYLWQTVAPE